MTPTRTASGNLWCLVDTPNPEEFTLCTFVDRSAIRLRDMPKKDSAYKDFTRMDPSLYDDHKDWKYAFMQTNAAPGDLTAFFWVRPRTQTQRDTPYETLFSMDQRSWPSICRWLRFDLDRIQTVASSYAAGTARGTAIVARYFVTKGWIPGGRFNTQIKTEFFLSDVPWPATEFDHLGLQPGDISWHFSDTEGGLPSCLHDKIKIPSRQNFATLALSGVSNAAETQTGILNDQEVPATTPTEWLDFVESDVPTYQNGQYLRIKVTCLSPVIPEVSIERL